ncbi:MAG: LPD1 domain-containing protein, partial [Roseibium sp.]|uniref:LPD1 domain-containing protein n=1 Tax=Roseibium sp. TaxID=1936156 RepID=UPI00329A12BC
PEDFMKAFSFRGVQFGNYVEKGRRQQDLNDSYDALMDLAFVLDMDSTAISLNGRLGLAFGARGRGGVNPASAHFEPMECVINLTKANGAGSLAHEWLHGVDNHLSHMTGRSSGMISAFLPARAGQVMRAHIFGEDALPDPIVAGLNEVNDAINRTGIAARCRQLDQTRSSPYYQLREEILARTFECYVIGRLEEKGIQNDYLANISPEAVYEATAALTGQPAGRYPYLKEDERESVFKAYDVLMRESGIAAHLMPEEARVNADPAHRTPAQIFDEVEFDQDQLEPEDRQSALYRPAGGGYDEVTSDQAAEAAPEKAEDDPGEEISWM